MENNFFLFRQLNADLADLQSSNAEQAAALDEVLQRFRTYKMRSEQLIDESQRAVLDWRQKYEMLVRCFLNFH